MLSQPAPSPKVTAKPERMKIQWKKGKLIGRGTFGSVYVGSNRETGALCAMNEVELLPDDPKSTECIKQLEQVGDRFYIYLEYVHPGSIVNYIRDHCGAKKNPLYAISLVTFFPGWFTCIEQRKYTGTSKELICLLMHMELSSLLTLGWQNILLNKLLIFL